MQLKERDGFTEDELQRALNDFSADTCSTMFGRLSGLATRLMEKFVNLVARKCGNHKGALAASHGCTAIPYLKNVYLPTLEQMGKQMAASNKKGTFLDEANLEMGTNTKKIGLSSSTRWNSRCSQVLKMVSPADFVTTLLVFVRAGEGGASEDYYEDAGRADATSAGCANKVQTREFFAFTQALGDLLPPLVKAGEKLQRWDLDRESYQLAVQSVVDHLQGCLDDPATFCPNLHNWRERAADAEVIGPKLKATRGRTDGWIDSQMRTLVESLLKEHQEYFEADQLTDQLDSLFDIHAPGVPTGNVGDAVLQSYYAASLDAMIDRYGGTGEHAFIDGATLRAEWESFCREYLTAARKFEAAWLLRENAVRRSDHAELEAKVKRRRDAQRKKNPAAAIDTLEKLPGVFVPLTRAPLAAIIGDAFRRESQVQATDPTRKPQVVMLLATWLTLMFSQAPIESNFSQMKLTKRTLRHRMSQSHLEMSMMIKINGPGSWNAEQAGLDADLILDTAHAKFMARSKRRVRRDAVSKMAEGPTRLAAEAQLEADKSDPVKNKHARYEWGKGFDHTPLFKEQEAQAKLQAKVNHRRRMETANASAAGPPGSFMIKSQQHGGEVARECVIEIGDMTVTIGDEVACTGFGGTVWYSGRVGAEERKGKKPLWVVYFGTDKSYARMPLDKDRYGKAKCDDVAPGQPLKWKAGWMFLVPETEADGLVVTEKATLGLDGAIAPALAKT